jgi:four helix bundle protein
MRDHTRLTAFQAADAFAVAVYGVVRSFPTHERYGLAAQLQRAAVSAAANIVEGCARETAADFARFLSLAYSSAREAQYEIDLSIRLGYVESRNAQAALREAAGRAVQLIGRLATRVRGFRASDR